METYPNSPVGEFAAIRSVLVSDRILATQYGLALYLLVAGSALTDKVGEVTADAFEAVLGASTLVHTP